MKIFKIFFLMLINFIMGSVIASFISPESAWIGGLLLVCIAIISPLLPKQLGILKAGVYTEVWTGEVVKEFNRAEEGSFLDGVPDYSRYADDKVIHLSEVTEDPDVLINNTTYPLTVQTLANGDVSISLDKFETKPTSVTDDELYALAFDKMLIVKEKHGIRLAESHLDKAIHAFAPAAHSANTPVILTTGETVDGRKKITRADIISLKNLLDKLQIPRVGRRLVLCADHVNDLLADDQKFRDQYHNYSTGVISKMYGFDIYEYPKNPYFTQAKAKVAFTGTPAATDKEASVFFFVPRMFKAKGSTKMYYSEASKDPLHKRNLISFTNRWIALPQKAAKAVGAIVSTHVAG